jgi:DNA polymerase-3 subunit alpha (Gram-positive type)
LKKSQGVFVIRKAEKKILKVTDPAFAYSVFSDVFESSFESKEQNNILSFGQIYGSFIEEKAKLTDLTYVIFDFETTGLSPQYDRIVEIGAVKVKNEKIEGTFEQLVYSDVPMKKQAQLITGIQDKDLKNAPKIETVLPKFLDFAKGSLLVAHNASFDMGMLEAACQRLSYHTFFQSLCTLKMSRSFLKLPNHKLDTLAKHYQLEFASRHRSLGDVMVTADVFKKFLNEHLFEKTFKNVAEFLI